MVFLFFFKFPFTDPREFNAGIFDPSCAGLYWVNGVLSAVHWSPDDCPYHLLNRPVPHRCGGRLQQGALGDRYVVSVVKNLYVYVITVARNRYVGSVARDR